MESREIWFVSVLGWGLLCTLGAGGILRWKKGGEHGSRPLRDERTVLSTWAHVRVRKGVLGKKVCGAGETRGSTMALLSSKDPSKVGHAGVRGVKSESLRGKEKSSKEVVDSSFSLAQVARSPGCW